MFLRNVGWIPIDLDGAVQKARAGDDGLAYFGKDQGNFIVMHVGFDLRVDTMCSGTKPIIVNQGFAYWVRGKGDMGGTRNEEVWEVHDIAEVTRAK